MPLACPLPLPPLPFVPCAAPRRRVLLEAAEGRAAGWSAALKSAVQAAPRFRRQDKMVLSQMER